MNHKPFKTLDEQLDLLEGRGLFIGKRVFFRLILIARLSRDTDAKLQEIVEVINALHKKYPFADLKHYGFMRNWEDILYNATK